MEESLKPSLFGAEERPSEPEQERSGLGGLSDQMAAGFDGVHQLQATGWQAPSDMEWREEERADADELEERDRPARLSRTRVVAISAGVFLAALLPRLIVLFFVTDPQNPGLGWYGDTFHHWQIAYLSKEIGFSQGFLRLWDLKGLEFFWGLLHPMVLITLFKLTGSVSIVIPRLVSTFGSSICLAMMFFLLRRHFGSQIAVGGTLLAIVNPVGIFSDSIGMQEPLGLVFLLGGMLLWPRNSFWTGVAFGVAGMVRSEYWLFGAGLTAAGLFTGQRLERKLLLAVGWLIPSLAYARYLSVWTGNPIYPVYWNFLGNAAGAWMIEAPLTPARLVARWTARVVLVIAVYASYRVLKQRRGYSLFVLLGLGNIIFLGLMWGVSSYIHGYIPRFVYDRLMVVPYIYLGIFLSIAAFRYLSSSSHQQRSSRVTWAAVGAVALAIQVAWIPIMKYYDGIRPIWEEESQLAEQIASKYEGGTIAFPEDRPALTYALVAFHDIDAHAFQSQMYDPYAYIDGDPYANWDENRAIVADWFSRLGIRLLVYDIKKADYERLVDREPAWFHRLGSGFRNEIKIYEVQIG